MIEYLILVNVSLAVYFIIYWLFLQKLTFFQWNRMYLLSTLALSVIVPLGVFMDWGIQRPYQEAVSPISFYVSYPLFEVEPTSEINLETFSWKDHIGTIYWTSVFFAFIWLTYRVAFILRAFKRQKSNQSFSFFNKIYVGKDVSDNTTIHAHENVHSRQGHSYDIFLVELIGLFNWFNPFIIYYKRELKFQHELIADECVTTDKVYYTKLLVAQALHISPSELRHEFSNYSFLKKRIHMLFKEKSSKNRQLNYIALIPVVIVLAIITVQMSCGNTSQNDKSVSEDTSLNDQTSTTAEIDTISTPVLEPQEARREAPPMIAKDTLIKFPEPRKEASSGTFGSKKSEATDEDPNAIFTAVTIPPEPPGGIDAFRKWVADTFDYPQEAFDAGAKGTVEATFVVEKDGSLSDIKATRDIGYETDKALLDVLKKAKKWKPGIQNGKPVRVQYKLPLRLDLSQL